MKRLVLLVLLGTFSLTSCRNDRDLTSPRPQADVSSTASTSLPFFDGFDRPDNSTVGNGWLEYELGGSAEISSNALHITTGSASGDGAKVYRPLPSESNLRVAGTVRFLNAFSRLWVLVRADGTESLRNGYGFSWRF